MPSKYVVFMRRLGEPVRRENVAVDLVIFTVRDDELQVLLVERSKTPYLGQLALPGGHLRGKKTLDDVALPNSKRKPALREHICTLSSCGPTATPNATHGGR